MPTFTFLVLYAFSPELILPLSWISLPFLFITTFIIPIISISILRVSGSISSLKMENREERIVPFVFITLFYGMTTYLFIFKVGVNELVTVVFVSTTLLIVILTVITSVFKISIHAAGMSGVCGYLLCLCWKNPGSDLLYPFIVLVVLAGCVMAARLHLNAHRPVEILAGSLIGLTTCFSALYWFA
ncbi:phosphatase PAP2 family protein [Reichenbachiella ulvae]|uniref:PA-phosphatase n=1 Tax=Reichenbachiella ulvae TaxID=2980104 RepID=A0ABT3CY48_9BACT|nr:PA-phosphatase [Reichenbachiella ulvae]MCV9388623.1 PA-phosphatase [Reichenbachiella ulvae]